MEIIDREVPPDPAVVPPVIPAWKIGRRLLAMSALTASFMNAAPALAQEPGVPEAPDVLPQTPALASCALLGAMRASVLDNCGEAEIPPACVTATTLEQAPHYSLSRQVDQMSRKLAVNPAVTSWTAAALKPHYELGIEDDGEITENKHYHRELLLALGRWAGAKRLRMVVYPQYFREEPGRERQNRMMREQYSTTIKEAKTCGYDVQLVLALNGTNWTSTRFNRFASSVTSSYGDEAESIAIGNEPNYPGWLRRMTHRTLAETYARLYKAGYHTIKQLNPNLKVIFGELSGLRWPLRFARQVIAAYRKLEGGKKTPMPVDEEGLHPYIDHQPDPDQPLNLDEHLKPDAKYIGANSLSTAKHEIRWLFEHKLIATTGGGQPRIRLDEFAQWVRTKGKLSYRNVRESVRTRNYINIQTRTCTDADSTYSGLVLYQVDSPPPARRGAKPLYSNGGMIDPSGKLDSTLPTEANWTRQYRATCLVS